MFETLERENIKSTGKMARLWLSVAIVGAFVVGMHAEHLLRVPSARGSFDTWSELVFSVGLSLIAAFHVLRYIGQSASRQETKN